MTSTEIPWNRYGLIVELSDLVRDKKPDFGKTALMKFMFLLQEIKNVNLGYRFSLYTYGPFTAQVLDDLDFTKALGGVNIEYIEYGPGGYNILPGEGKDELKERAKDFIDEHGAQIREIVDEFGDKYAKDLELISTIVYVDRSCKIEGESVSAQEIADKVKGIKPRFDIAKIRAQVDALAEHNYISPIAS